MYDERIGLLNQQLELVKSKEELVEKQMESNQIVSKNLKNKADWPFSSYDLCFNIKTIHRFRLLLPTALVRLEVNGTVSGPFRALLDSGAQPTLISHILFKRLRCVASQASKMILGVASAPYTMRKKVSVVIRPWFESNECYHDEAWVLPHEATWAPLLPSHELKVHRRDAEFRQRLADPAYYQPRETHIILGVGFVAKMFEQKLGYEPDGTALISTSFGNVVMGEHTESIQECDEEGNAIVSTLINNDMGKELNALLERLWEMDEVGKALKGTQEEEMAEQHFKDTYYRDRDGRFCVKIPIKPGIDAIGSSRSVAWRRFKCLEGKLQRAPEMREFYVKEMRELILKGHVKEVNRRPKPNEICYYIPHHFVSIKPRVVYDASCPTNTGVSLNEVQMIGPKIQTDLNCILMRLQRHKYVWLCDVTKMFNQVNLNEDQWDCQRIFWREDPSDELKEYWITVVTFGLASSPFLAQRCLLQAARDAQEEYPVASKVIAKDFYMDDCASGNDTVPQAIKTAKEVEKILDGAGFKLTKWKSNKKEIMEAISPECTEMEKAMVFAQEGQTSILGIKWLFGVDKYTFVVKTPLVKSPLTKRKIASCVAQLYDPNGYIAPVVVCGKILIQELWKEKLDWDEVIEGRLERAWNEFWKEIKYLGKFRIDRWLGTSAGSNTQLMGFSDSSTRAYGAVLYARTEFPDGSVRCRLIVSKSRVAPLKPMTIPRLELAAAELLARLLIEVRESMEFGDMPYIMWTDSSATLYWIRNDPHKLKVYVAHRVTAIQQNTEIKHWRYVNTKDNPADLVSRGVKPSDLVENQLWLCGPEWLSKPEDEWPAEKFPMKMSEEIEEEWRVHLVSEFKDPLSLEKYNEEGTPERVSILEYSDTMEKALRILAYVIRYLNAKRNGYKPPQKITRRNAMIIHPPTEEEKEWAMQYYLRKSQQAFFNAEYTALVKGKCISEKSKLIALNPRLDSHGVMRVGGRLEKSALETERKHPAIVPKGSRLAYLLMEQAHRKNLHGGVQIATHYIRRRYWIPQLRDELKQFTRNCMECVRNKPATQEQLMGDLPADRVTPGRAFEATGVDYAGPFHLKYVDKDCNEIVRVNAWAAVFVCMKTRAVHLDLVNDLTSSSFVACFERFVARRGHCYKMFSDNGTSFVGAEKEIARAYREWQTDGTVDRLANKGTQWTFMTPAAPHQGGIYEAAVKSMKHHLKRVVGPRVCEYVQFTTLLCGIEAILNSRPLTPQNDSAEDANDFEALTPGHFLIGEPFVAPPPFRCVNDSNLEGRRLWNEREKMLKQIWDRWVNEYLQTFLERKKWRRALENLKPGMLVIIKDENLAPMQWKLARITEIILGADGLARNAIVRTATGLLKRPIQKLCVMPTDAVQPKDCPETNRRK